MKSPEHDLKVIVGLIGQMFCWFIFTSVEQGRIGASIALYMSDVSGAFDRVSVARLLEICVPEDSQMIYINS